MTGHMNNKGSLFKDWFKQNIVSSIKGKYATFLVIAVILASILVGGSSVYIMNRKIDSDTTASMNLHCRQVASNVNDALRSTEQSVRFMEHYISAIEPTLSQLKFSESYMGHFNHRVKELFNTVTEETVGAATYYLRYNPDEFSPTAGFLYSKEYQNQSLGDEFYPLPPTDFSQFSPDDEDVSWFFTPMRTGEGTWIPPYWGDNLQMNMISYVKPIIFEGEKIGVIGMDIDFDLLLQMIESEKMYESAAAFIVGQDGSVINAASVHSPTARAEATYEVNEFKNYLNEADSSDSLISYEYRGVPKRMVFATLNNGMKLIYVANSSDIYHEQNVLLNNAIFIGIIIACACAFVGYALAGQIVRPVENLTKVAKKMGSGDLNVVVPDTNEKDEVGELARAFQSTLMHLQEYIDYVQDLAYKDGLTGTQNRAAYSQAMETMEVEIRLGRAEFAIVMVDLNHLKRINDVHGHDKGNAYIKNLCNVIKSIYAFEDIYRIGGDEFVVMIQDDEYRKRDVLFTSLREKLAIKEDTENVDPWDNVSAASGMAAFDPSMDDTPNSVFKRADEEMYKNKLEMKACRV